MVGWWAKRRVVACIKDLRRELECGDAVKRAKILVLAQSLRLGMFPENDPQARVLLNTPSEIPGPDLMYLYERLEQIIVNNRRAGMTLRRNQRAIFGTDIPPFLQDHWAIVQRS